MRDASNPQPEPEPEVEPVGDPGSEFAGEVGPAGCVGLAEVSAAPRDAGRVAEGDVECRRGWRPVRSPRRPREWKAALEPVRAPRSTSNGDGEAVAGGRAVDADGGGDGGGGGGGGGCDGGGRDG